MKISIGIVTFNNSQEQLKRLLQSIFSSYKIARQKFAIELSIIGVDNGQACLESAIQDSENLPVIARQILKSEGNVGFGCAMNRLMRQAFETLEADDSADLFIAVNPDGLLHSNCLTALLEAASKHTDALLEARQFPEEHPKPYSMSSGDTPWATGACLAIPRRIFESIGGFDENLFMYGEDVDLSWRARAAGFTIKLIHDAIFVHPTLGRAWSRDAKKHFFLSFVYLAAKWRSEDFQHIYEEQFRTRFSEAEDIALLNNAINSAREASGSIIDTTGFAPIFDESKTFCQPRWSY